MPPVDDLPTMERYDLIFEGEIREGASIDDVKKKLARLYDVNIRKIDALFTGEPVVIKKSMDLVTALEDKEVFEATGAVLRLEPVSKPETTVVPEMPKPHPAKPAKTALPDTDVPVDSESAAEPPSPITALSGAFYSAPLYRRAAQYWRRHAIVYLLLLSVLYSVSAIYRFKAEVGNIAEATLPVLARQLPEIAIDGGRVRIDGPEPYRITAPGTDEVVAILDTTGEHSSLDDTTAVLLLTEDRLLVRRGPGGVREFDLSGVDGFRMNQDRMMAWMRSMMVWMPIVIFPFVALAAFAYRLIQALLFGALGLAVSASLRRPLTFRSSFNIAAVALTPVIVADTLFNLFGVSPSYWSVVSLLIVSGFTIYGIHAATASTEA